MELACLVLLTLDAEDRPRVADRGKAALLLGRMDLFHGQREGRQGRPQSQRGGGRGELISSSISVVFLSPQGWERFP